MYLKSPAQLAAKAPAPRLTPTEQRVLARVKAKIERIRRDLLYARGLTQEGMRHVCFRPAPRLLSIGALTASQNRDRQRLG